jgi:hypothetical protein
MCHELGHTPGLDHVDTGSCMNDSQEAVFQQEVPINKDFRELERIYQHQDDTTTVGGKQQDDKKDKKDRKRKRDRDDDRHRQDERRRDEQAEPFSVETLADGRKVVSFITWAHDASAEAVTQNGPLRAP